MSSQAKGVKGEPNHVCSLNSPLMGMKGYFLCIWQPQEPWIACILSPASTACISPWWRQHCYFSIHHSYNDTNHHHTLEFIPIPIAAPSEPPASTLVPIASTDNIHTPQQALRVSGRRMLEKEDMDGGRWKAGYVEEEDAIYASLYVKGCYFGKLCMDSGLIPAVLASALLANFISMASYVFLTKVK
ncbi:hypothetical protein EDD85DRAFT_794090 [Armillaria nabsnona]|nr:hypothetical protein EDD85DRAFT_794090 [Armillaria nabsnona]